tara:strand:+ start:178 stop:930 length:753 start_codon:yes stop_codon:yes gene_type:complete
MEKSRNLIWAIASSIIVITLSIFGFELSETSSIFSRIFKLFGGDFITGGYIQFLTFIMFFWAMLEMNKRKKEINFEHSGFDIEALPKKANYVIYPDEINNIRLRIQELEKSHDYLLLKLIKKACTKFIRTKSVAETQEIISSQIKVNLRHSESAQSMTNYMLWAIPSFGFIGTVLGISNALAMAATNPNDIEVITGLLSVAFDTTLIALLLSVIAMWFFHYIEEKESKFHADMEEYLNDNLVNRIDTQHE